VQSFRAAECDTDHCLLVAEVRERLAVNKQRLLVFHVEKFTPEKLNIVEGNEQYHFEVSAEVDVNTAWETIGESITFSAKDSQVIVNGRSISCVSEKDVWS
jgi:hypothetical protein